MNRPMTLDEAEKFDTNLFKKTFVDNQEEMGNYQFDDDEYMEYVLLRKERTHLPVDCMADDGGSFKMNNHSLWFLIANGYERPIDEFIPITVDKFAKIDGNFKLKISKGDFEKIREFIFNNMSLLIKLGNNEIDNADFLKNMRVYHYAMAESVNKKLINEMAKLRKEITNLPTDIWIDDAMGVRTLEHGSRIKFQTRQGERNPRNYSTIRFNDKGEVAVDEIPLNTYLKHREIIQIVEFVKLNYDLLIALSKNQIDMDYFKANFKPLP